MKKIYVAGPYSGDNVLTIFANMRKGMVLASQVRQLGYAPFCPWMDFMYFFVNHGKPFDLQNCYEYSLAWLEVSDGIIFTPDWRTSKGAREEHTYAIEHFIPIFYSIAELTEKMPV